MSQDHNRRKRHLLIEKDFQLRFTLRMLLFNGVILLAFGGFLLFVVRLNYEMLIRDALIQMPDIVENLRRELRFLSLSLSLATVFVLFLLFVSGIVLSQRIAGPLIALKRRLKDLSLGRHPIRLRLRAYDEFQDLEALFNSAMEEQDKVATKRFEHLQNAINMSQKHENLLELKNELQEALKLSPRPQQPLGGPVQIHALNKETKR